MSQGNSGTRRSRVARRLTRASYWRREVTTARLLKPAYFSLLLRWCTWLLALLLATTGVSLAYNTRHAPVMLLMTGLWLLAQTLYLPLLRPSLPLTWRRAGSLTRRFIRALDQGVVVSVLDVVLSGLAIYATGGWGSPFYVYGLASVVMPSLLFGYRAAWLVGLGFAVLFGLSVLLVPDGAQRVSGPGALDGLIGYLFVPTPLALFAAYLGQVLRQFEVARDRVQRALAEARLLQSVTSSGLRHVAAPGAFVAETIAIVHRAAVLRGLAIVYRLPGKEEAETVVWEVAGFGPVYGLAEMVRQGQALPGPTSLVRAFPLTAGGQRLGVMLAAARSIEPRVAFLTTLAGQVTAALANAHLYAAAEDLAAQAERARLAREIHDGIAQSLFMLSLNLDACTELAQRDPARLPERLTVLAQVARQALWETRLYINDLKPLLDEGRGVLATLESQAREFGAVSGLAVTVTARGEEPPLGLAVKQALYRIAQEGLANVFRHAGASQVRIVVVFDGAGVRLTIEDDGRGFVAPVEAGGHGRGLDNMRQRAGELGGALTLDSQPGQGTRLSVWLPTPALARAVY